MTEVCFFSSDCGCSKQDRDESSFSFLWSAQAIWGRQRQYKSCSYATIGGQRAPISIQSREASFYVGTNGQRSFTSLLSSGHPSHPYTHLGRSEHGNFHLSVQPPCLPLFLRSKDQTSGRNFGLYTVHLFGPRIRRSMGVMHNGLTEFLIKKKQSCH